MRPFILNSTKSNDVKKAHGTPSAYEPASEGDDLQSMKIFLLVKNSTLKMVLI